MKIEREKSTDFHGLEGFATENPCNPWTVFKRPDLISSSLEPAR
jgi:hypothetical protein